MSAAVNVPGGRDTIGHSSVQGWSAGEHFPAVVSTIESYDDWGAHNATASLANRRRWVAFEVTLDGVSRRYATAADALMVARCIAHNPDARRAWRDTAED